MKKILVLPLLSALAIVILIAGLKFFTLFSLPEKTESNTVDNSNSPVNQDLSQSFSTTEVNNFKLPFSIEDNYLPPYYSGFIPKSYLDFFESKIKELKSHKDQFETTKEYEKRMNEIEANFASSDLIAFRIKFPVTYDADKQVYVFGSEYIGCDNVRESAVYARKEDWYTCFVSEILRQKDSYTATNAFGVSTVVNRTIGKDFAIAIKRNSSIHAVFKDHEALNIYEFNDKLSIPLEKARSMRDQHVSILFIGQVIGSEIIEGRATVIKPSINQPNEVYILNEAIPFSLKYIFYYVYETGEVLGKRNLVEPVKIKKHK